MGELKTIVLGDGLLGKEIASQSNWKYISRKKDGIDASNFESWKYLLSDYQVIVNCIANTNTYSEDRQLHWDVNYKFVYELIVFCNSQNKKLVHISTDYVYSNSRSNSTEYDVPVHNQSWYGYTKNLADGLVQLLSSNYLLCRCMHKPNPFPYESAWVDQIGSFDYVDIIASQVIALIEKESSGVFNLGTKLKSIYDLASQTKKVTAIHAPVNAPKDVSTCVDKLMNELSSESPFFSIVIPAYGYNGQGHEFLETSFNKLVTQTFSDFEVVVSDHSIDDNIENFCYKWKQKLNVKYYKNERGRGIISPNLNNALCHSVGRWVKILFQDDFLYDDFSLEKQYLFITQNTDMHWFATRFVHTNDGVNFYRDFVPSWNDNIWAGNNSIGCPSVITMKKESVMLFDEDLNWLMDCEWYLRMFHNYGHPRILNEITVVNRNNPGRLSNTISDEQKKDEYEKLRQLYAESI